MSVSDVRRDVLHAHLVINPSDQSIFTPGGGPPQVGFRRSELIPATNNGSDSTVQGTTTFHWSIRNDPLRPLNFSHEYHVRYCLQRTLCCRYSRLLTQCVPVAGVA